MEPLLPKQGHGPKRKDDRKVLNGIFYILRTGAPGIAKIMTEAVEVQFFCLYASLYQETRIEPF